MIPFKTRLTGYLETLRFPWLMALAALAFLVDLFVPDALPFVDEILLALIAILLGRLKRKPKSKPEPPGTEPPA